MGKIITTSAKQTRDLGRELAEKVTKSGPQKKAVVLGLRGNLGSGKTTFLQGFARGLGIKEKILSPTFVIMKRFQFNNLTIKQFNNFYHIDCYRINKPEEILELGFGKIISSPLNIVAVEWSEKITRILPKNSIAVNFKFIDESKREISFKM